MSEYLCKRGNQDCAGRSWRSPARCAPATRSRWWARRWDCCCCSFSGRCCSAAPAACFAWAASWRAGWPASGPASTSSMARTFACAARKPTFYHESPPVPHKASSREASAERFDARAGTPRGCACVLLAVLAVLAALAALAASAASLPTLAAAGNAKCQRDRPLRH